jgi:formylglycine-generating enzyme required for sulfatase activity
VVLTSSTSTQKSYEDKEGELSLYTNYIVQGIESGAAESDGDGMISADELHEYAKRHVQSAKPAMKPEIYGIRQGIKIRLARARVDAKLEYRRLVERYAENGEISFVGQDILEVQRERWGLSDEVAIAIENEVLEPVRRRLKNLARYEKSLERACKQMFPLTEKILGQLKDLQEVLGLRDEDVLAIQERVLKPYEQQELEAENLRQRQQRQAEIRKQQELDLERQRQVELEEQRLRDAEQEKLKAEAKRQSASEAEQQRQERQMLVDFEEQRLRDAEQESLKAEVKRQLEHEAKQRRQEQQNLQSKIENPNSIEQPKLPFRLSRRNFILVAGFSGVSVVTFAAIRGSQTPTNNSTNTSTPITVNTSQPKPFTVETGKPFKIELENGVNLDMVYIPSGKFTMGSPPEEKGGEDKRERPQIKDVNISAFYMGKYEVTQAQWQAIMGGNPASFKYNLQNPVQQVSWDDAQDFCKKLSQQTGREFRLPSESEWEYACRAGTTTAYSFGDNASLLGDYAWYRDNSDSKTHPVGQKKPNPWGLYDMHGNVWEWCQDSYERYGGENDLIRKTGIAVTKVGFLYFRLLRGGSWFNFAEECRSAYRLESNERDQAGYIGFRVVCVLR